MIVQAPDGKNIDFGDLAPEQVTGAMQKLYPSGEKQFGTGDYLQQVAKGGTFGLVDEIGAGIGAGMRALDKGSLKDIGEDYNIGLEGLRADQARFEQDHPYQSMGLQFLGGVPGGLQAGAALSNSLRGANLATRMLASSAAGAASGGAYGFGAGEGKGRLQSAGQGAMAGALLGAALPAAPPAAGAVVKSTGKAASEVGAGMLARNSEKLLASSEAKKKAAGGIYDEMRSIGATFNQNKTKSILSDIDSAVAQHQFIPELNPKTTAIIGHLRDTAAKGELSLGDLDQYRRLLSRVGGSEDGVSAGAAKKAIDAAVDSSAGSDLAKGDMRAVSLLNKGRADYAKASRFEDVSDVIVRADGDPNRLKAGLTRFVNNSDNLRGFSPKEIAALRDAARTGIGENILKAFGKFGFDFSKSGTGNTVLPALLTGGGLAGVPGGLPLAIGGTISRQAQKYMARGKAERALRMIEQ